MGLFGENLKRKCCIQYEQTQFVMIIKKIIVETLLCHKILENNYVCEDSNIIGPMNPKFPLCAKWPQDFHNRNNFMQRPNSFCIRLPGRRALMAKSSVSRIGIMCNYFSTLNLSS